MSLLNEVLRDIDHRRRESRDTHILTSVLASPEREPFNWTYPTMVLVVVFLCGSLTYWAVNRLPSPEVLQSRFELPQYSSPLATNRFFSEAPSVAKISTPSWTPAPDLVLSLPSIAPARSTRVASIESKPERKRQRSEPQKMLQDAALTFETAVDQALSRALSMAAFANQFTAQGDLDADAVMTNLNKFNYATRSEDDLLDLLAINKRAARTYDIDRTSHIQAIFQQLRLKSNESGYWAFQQAVMYDKASEAKRAYYYYKKALQSTHITHKQRRLSEWRMEQLQSSQR